MAAKFLCCLPLRLGVVVISFLQFLFCGAIAGSLWWALCCYGHSIHETAAIVVAAIYSAAALVAFLGLLGAFSRKTGLVKAFFLLLSAILLVEIGGSIWYLTTFYRNRHQTLAECINGSSDSNRIAYCNSLDAFKRIHQGVLLTSVIVPIVLQAYACYVVYYYFKRLESQRVERQRASQVFQPSGPVYQPVKVHDDAFPVSQPTYQYPYADTANSFGHTHQHSFAGNDAGNKL
ncbi:hypothetical protein CPB84DRAFT_1837113 [Gymnopilus junonius]|uniref:Uncharacterized protein n=1 Tax=Gymnopilus junonius TaxID=109634 RepID=A0A9P5NN48_GYMJU|nr:hypothetical protein CPB84DRAFT_1837113 [Gymnopilus junonius]